jgi:streptogramin lyase
MPRLSTVLRSACALLVFAFSAASPASSAATSGRIVEFHIPSPGSTDGIAAAPDGTQWFSERYTDQIGRVTNRGKFQMYSFPLQNHMSTAITAGPDGAIWFTFPNSVPPYDSGKIGRITTSGAASFYSIPWTSDAEAITAGPDGNLWFADHVASAIGRVTTSGAMTKFPIQGGSGTFPYKIAAGPDGALWFTDFNGHRIGRITTGGQVSFFAVPSASGSPDAITAGPDGNLWFTLDDTGRIARMTTTGTLTEYQLGQPPGDYVFLGGITSGPDGALWFTYQDYTSTASKIGRITTSGAVSLFPTPTQNSSPQGITVDHARRAVWFTEAAAQNVGRIKPR